jgi:hypothetical protein
MTHLPSRKLTGVYSHLGLVAVEGLPETTSFHIPWQVLGIYTRPRVP